MKSLEHKAMDMVLIFGNANTAYSIEDRTFFLLWALWEQICDAHRRIRGKAGLLTERKAVV